MTTSAIIAFPATITLDDADHADEALRETNASTPGSPPTPTVGPRPSPARELQLRPLDEAERGLSAGSAR
ncbi:hypothetical protein GCM10011512_12890 [Tersicoccus solisilvae]|uniref:Uncharacterized protein n=1 Tax=Tersicoccus solisilvae TaxID=1882339 RepID=A0ABQ1NZN8_9MICC|nr:hypothetical protein GCM10011512_12890 [Tersicoccus solisilvae]